VVYLEIITAVYSGANITTVVLAPYMCVFITSATYFTYVWVSSNFAWPVFAVVNCFDGVMSEFYSPALACSLIFLQF